MPPPKKHVGLLGNLDTYTSYLLLIGGNQGIQENIESTVNPITFYTSILEEQGMIVKSTINQKIKDIQRVWIEIDPSTNIQEYTQWNELDKNDNETLAWKPFLFPCLEGTKKECLGLSVVAKEKYIFQGKHKASIYDIMSTLVA
jgi:hypothetical protein